MRLTLLLAAVLIGAAFAGTLYLVPSADATANDARIIVHRSADHTVAFGSPDDDSRILSNRDVGLERFAMVTVRNENGVSQVTELGEVVYRDGRTLIVLLHHPLNGDFVRDGVFNVKPLTETRAPSAPIHIPVRGEYDDIVADIVAAVSEDTLIAVTTNYENYVTRYSNADGYDTACEWSHNTFLSYGLDSEIQTFSMFGYECQNVIATQTGTVNPDQYWIICGHLDSTSPVASSNAPGADDNASGSAAVMEAARVMSQYDFEYTVKYCLWGGEEQGLYGSEYYADAAAAAGHEILGVVNLDMIFYGPAPDDIAQLHYNTASTGLGLAFDAISDTYVPALQKSVASSPVSASDHASFWSAGYPAMLSIEIEVWSNPYYHQTTDIMANYLQYFPFGTNMAKGAIATVAHLAVPVETSVEDEFGAAVAPDTGIELLSNPVTTTASMTISVPASCTVSLGVFDLSGREVMSTSRETQQGSNTFTIDVSSLPPGMYLIKADALGSTTTSRMAITE